MSGRYFHNIKSTLTVPPAKLTSAASGHVNGTLYKDDSFGVHLRAKAGYNVGMFGKSNFNTYDGFDRWFQGLDSLDICYTKKSRKINTRLRFYFKNKFC